MEMVIMYSFQQQEHLQHAQVQLSFLRMERKRIEYTGLRQQQLQQEHQMFWKETSWQEQASR